jgi:DNA-binding NtrC family response regulator
VAGPVSSLRGLEEVQADIRVIAATNQDLTRLVAEGRFREDLFYRINVIPISLPPLRERREDIGLLAEHFLSKYNEVMGKDITGISHEAMALLMEHDWPGNIRELENVLERAVALEATPAILPDSLPPNIRGEVARGGTAPVDALPESGFDLEAHVNFSSVKKRPEPSRIIAQVGRVFLIEARSKQINRHLQFGNQFRLGRMARLPAHRLKSFEILFVQSIQLRDQDIDGMRENESAVRDGERLRARPPKRTGAEVQRADRQHETGVRRRETGDRKQHDARPD